MFFADVSPFQYIVDFIFFLQTFEPHVKIKENGFLTICFAEQNFAPV